MEGAEDGGLGDFTAEGIANLDCGKICRIKLLGGQDGELRNLSRAGELGRTAPVAVAAESINIGKHPAGDDVIGLVAGQAGEIESNGDALRLEAYQEGLGGSDQLESGFGSALAGDGFDKGRSGESRLRGARQENTKSRLLDPGADIFKSGSPMSVLAHPFGARCF